MLFIYVLSWLGIIDKKQTVVRKGVWNFAFYSLAALLLFIVLALTGVLDRL